MKSLFDNSTYGEVIKRLNQLSPSSQRLWGKMEVAQMLAHCKGPLYIALEKKKMKEPNFFMKLLFKTFKPTMYNDKLWKPNLPSAKALIISDERDFTSEKEQLTKLITDFYNKGYHHKWPKHPAFGEFTPQQWGQIQYKHLDHHLRQFGV